MPEQVAQPECLTDKSGEFRLQGLYLKTYEVWAVHPNGLLAVSSPPILAGAEGVVLSVPPGSLLERLEGTVTDGHGAALSGVRIVAESDLGNAPERTVMWGRFSTLSDPTGFFSLANVPTNHVKLSLSGDEIIPAAVPLDHAEDCIVIQVDRRRQLMITRGLSEVDSVSMARVDGTALDMWLFQAKSAQGPLRRLSIDGGNSAVVTVGESASTLIGYHSDKEVLRIPLELSESAVSTIALD